MNTNIKYLISENIISAKLDKLFYILNLETGKYLKVNSSSNFIFDCIEDNLSCDEIINSIVQKYNISYELSEKELNLFIDMAKELKLIKNKQNN